MAGFVLNNSALLSGLAFGPGNNIQSGIYEWKCKLHVMKINASSSKLFLSYQIEFHFWHNIQGYVKCLQLNYVKWVVT